MPGTALHFLGGNIVASGTVESSEGSILRSSIVEATGQRGALHFARFLPCQKVWDTPRPHVVCGFAVGCVAAQTSGCRPLNPDPARAQCQRVWDTTWPHAICRFAVDMPAAQSLTHPKNLRTPNAFRTLRRGTLACAQCQRVWDTTRPHAICGFAVDRAAAEALLAEQPVGTFLVRTCSEAGAFSISCCMDGLGGHAFVDHLLVDAVDLHTRCLEAWVHAHQHALQLLDPLSDKLFPKVGRLNPRP